MNPTNIKLVAAVTAVTVFDRVIRSKINQKNQTFAQHNVALIEINKLLLQQCEELATQLSARIKVNDFLTHQNEYLVGMLDTHNVPVTEFDKIAMTYPITKEEK